MRAEPAPAPLRLRGGLPLEEPPVADEHAPERRQRGGEADPALMGQQPEPHEALHDSPAQPRQQPGVMARPRLLALPQAALGEEEQDAPGQRQQRRQRRDRQRLPRQQKAGEDGQKRHRRQEAAAQAVEQPPAVNGGERGREEKGQILPVAPHPAVQALIVGERAAGEAVGERDVAHEAAAQQRALRRVVREDAALRHVPFAAQQEAAQVDQPLPGEAPAVEGVHIQLAAEPAIGVRAAGPGEDQREIGGVGALQLGVQPGMEDAVPGRDHGPLCVGPGAAQRVEHRADQLASRAGIEARVAVEREDEARAFKRRALALDRKLALASVEQRREREQRAALALMPAPALAVEAARAGEEIKAAAVAAVERGDGL